jgi:hypothetical protein
MDHHGDRRCSSFPVHVSRIHPLNHLSALSPDLPFPRSAYQQPRLERSNLPPTRRCSVVGPISPAPTVLRRCRRSYLTGSDCLTELVPSTIAYTNSLNTNEALQYRQGSLNDSGSSIRTYYQTYIWKYHRTPVIYQETDSAFSPALILERRPTINHMLGKPLSTSEITQHP